MRILRKHVPEMRAREPGRSVEDGADSFVVEDGKIVFQTIHYTLQETMPNGNGPKRR